MATLVLSAVGAAPGGAMGFSAFGLTSGSTGETSAALILLGGAYLAVRNMMNATGVALPEAVNMASTSPAAFLRLGEQVGTIDVGKRANFVVTDDDLRVAMTWIDGKVVYER